MHIKTFKLSCLRGVNYAISNHADTWGADAGYDEMPQADLGLINVFCGRNGAGKSTVLDVVRTLRSPKLLTSLRRTSASVQALRAFELEFDGAQAIHVQFKINEIDVKVFSRLRGAEQLIGRAFPWVDGDTIDLEEIVKIKRAICALRPKAFHWRGPDQISTGPRFVEALSKLEQELICIARNDGIPAIRDSGNGQVGIQFESGDGLPDNIPTRLLPSGWQAAAALLAWMKRLPTYGIATIEEPETHLHPRLQRRVARELARLAKQRRLQLLISTHSAVFMNRTSWVTEDGDLDEMRLFQVDGRRFKPISRRRAEGFRPTMELLDDLGVLASDVLQANAVIWVEGPSDRIYIRYWLRRWCAQHEFVNPTENVDYVFCFYGGSILSHFSAYDAGQADDVTDMIKLNRNSFVVMDRDDDFIAGDDESIIRTKRNPCSKYRIADALVNQVWITARNTIESYLPVTYVDGKLLQEDTSGRTSIGTSTSKVGLARQYVADSANLPYSEIFREGISSPCKHLKAIHSFILEANK